jgi:hypothetical protein
MNPLALFRTVTERLLALLLRTDTTLAEFWSSTMLLAWGIGFLDPWPEPAGCAESIVAQSVGEFGGEVLLGSICLLLGAAQSFGNLKGSRRVRRVSAFCASVFFGFLCILALGWMPSAVFAKTTAVASFVQAIVYLRLSLSAPRTAVLR